jgi:hypothetical protein
VAKKDIAIADLEGTWKRKADGKEAKITVDGESGAIGFKGVEFDDWEFGRYSSVRDIGHFRRTPKRGPEGAETREIKQVNLPEWAKLKALDTIGFHWKLALQFDSGFNHMGRDNCDLRFTGALLPGFIKAITETETVEIEAPLEPNTLDPQPKSSIEVTRHDHVRYVVPDLAEWLTAAWADETAAEAAFAHTGYGSLCAESVIKSIGSFGVTVGVKTSVVNWGKYMFKPVLAVTGGSVGKTFVSRFATAFGTNLVIDSITGEGTGIDTLGKALAESLLGPLASRVPGPIRGIAQKGLDLVADKVAGKITKQDEEALGEYLKNQCRFQFVAAQATSLDKTPVALMAGVMDTCLGTAKLHFYLHEHSFGPAGERRICPWSLVVTELTGLPEESRKSSFGGKIRALCSVVKTGELKVK